MPLRDRLLARPPAARGGWRTPVAPIANAVTLAHRPGRRALRRRSASTATRPARATRARTSSRGRGATRRRAAATRTVVYFHGCAANYNEPRVGRMAVEVLEHNGFGCSCRRRAAAACRCSRTARSSGPRLRPRAGRALAPCARDGYDIVGDVHELRADAEAGGPGDPGIDDPDLTWSRADVRHLRVPASTCTTQGELRTDLRAAAETVPYHAPCQQRGHGFGKPALDLFALIPELGWSSPSGTAAASPGRTG